MQPVDAQGSGFSGITLSYNAKFEEEADEIIKKAKTLSATIIKLRKKVYRKNYSGYFNDLNRHLFEVAYNPFLAVR